MFTYSKFPEFPTDLFNLAQTQEIGKRYKFNIFFGFLAELGWLFPAFEAQPPSPEGFGAPRGLRLTGKSNIQLKLPCALRL
ncbi:MAG: hypothetical protein P8175_01720 [Deltaproteobacteria bacterium]